MPNIFSQTSPCRRRLLAQALGAAAVVAAFAAALPAQAQTYPDRPIKLVVPWPAGGTTDLAGRAFAQALAKSLGGLIVVENRPGATGVVGADAVAKAVPDGYTLLVASAETQVINPFTYERLQYDPNKDSIPIGAFAINPFSIVARADFPAATIRDLADLAKKNPGKYTYSSASLGSASQIVMEMFKEKTGLDILHVPYQGEAPAVTALMGGQVDIMVLPVGRAQSFSQSGKIKVYAVTLPKRYAGLSDVPTLREQGFDIEVVNWFAIMAPAKTPAPIVEKLSAAIQAALRQPETAKALNAIGLQTFPSMSQADFQKFVDNESARWGGVIKAANIRAK